MATPGSGSADASVAIKYTECHAVKSRPSISRRAGRAAVPLLLLCGLAAGCGPTITVPNVVGMRLDAAHQKFEALGVAAIP